MLPKQHAAVSFAVTAAAAAVAGLAPLPFVAWVVVGTVVGVLVDADHLVLAALVDGNVTAVRTWLTDPVGAVTRPYTFIEDVRYGGRWMYVHRLVSHLVILVGLFAFARVHWIGVPASIGLAAHIAADIVWDLYRNNYGLWR